MAVELVAGALLSTSLEFLFERIGSGEVLAYLRRKSKSRDIDELVGKLKRVLNVVMAVIEDAEQKQRKSKRVEAWLDMLQDVVFDAEDFFDSIEFDAMELKEKAESSIGKSKKHTVWKKKIRNFIKPSRSSDSGDMENKVKELLKRFEDIATEKDLLGLNKNTTEDKASWRLPSTSLVDESSVYGRDDDKGGIIDVLLSDDLSSEKTCVISIVGIGGVGKTTLAQTVYSNSKVKDHFELKAWVCVSEIFDVYRVTKAILEEVASGACDIKELNQLQVKLKQSLTGQKFLIVLDDVWCEKSADLDVLCLPFKEGAKGSKIIVTTRSEDVSSSMLQKLSEDACWKLFAKEASSINGDFTRNQELEIIGRKIVEKCDGLPLALKTLGGLLRSTLEVKEWRRILECDIWDLSEQKSNILPALKLSYHYLPSQLKRCFAFCSIFPTDYEFKKEELVLLWMAENLLDSPKGNMRIEDVGEEYFNGLVSRSFFQPSYTPKKSVFVMHDLIHELAKSVSLGYFLHLEDKMPSEVKVSKVRHLGYIAREVDPYERLCDVLQATKLRTFLPQNEGYGYTLISNKAMNELLLKLRCLRVLSFREYDNVNYLPDSIGELRLLRYLDASKTNISTLPESICKLRNLQTLKLKKCQNLTSLPKEVHRLINLRHLDISECNKLVEMPPQLSKLKNLQTLSTFIVGKDNNLKIEELRELPNLVGELCIQKLENVGNAEIAPNHVKILDRKHLDTLKLEWSYDSNVDAELAKNVLEMLLASKTLKELSISGYSGLKVSNYLMINFLDGIVSLTLSRCTNCTALPPLGQLPSLKILDILDFDVLVDVGLEFYGDGLGVKKPFQSLENLRFSGMKSWETWLQDDSGAFAQLMKLEVRGCGKLTGVLPSFLPSATKVTISGCDNLASSLPRAPHILELHIRNCKKMMPVELSTEAVMRMESRDYKEFGDSSYPITVPIGGLYSSLKKGLEIKFDYLHPSLEKLKISSSCEGLKCLPIDYFPKLKELNIYELGSLESLSMSNGFQSQNFASLTSMWISGCSSIVCFPKGGLSAPNLNDLRITGCEKLKSLPEKMKDFLTLLKSLEVGNCPEIEWPPEDCLPSSLIHLDIYGCSKVIASRKNWGLKRLRNLRDIRIGDYNNKDVESFPEEEGMLSEATTDLSIEGFPSLKWLHIKQLLQLTSLELCNLPKLQTIPGQVFPTSLKELTVHNCNDEFVRTVCEDSFPSSLQYLIISECRIQHIILKGLPTSLKYIYIQHCDELQSVAVEEGLPSSLHQLIIYFCPKLSTIPTTHFPKSLQKLRIHGCPLLTDKCKPEKGEYWKDIAHIPFILIDDYFFSP